MNRWFRLFTFMGRVEGLYRVLRWHELLGDYHEKAAIKHWQAIHARRELLRQVEAERAVLLREFHA